MSLNNLQVTFKSDRHDVGWSYHMHRSTDCHHDPDVEFLKERCNNDKNIRAFRVRTFAERNMMDLQKMHEKSGKLK